MSTIAQIADKIACSGANGANTGKLGCLSLFGEPNHALVFRKGHVISQTEVFNIAYLGTQLQKGKLTPLIDASKFEDVSTEDSMSTNSKGIERLNLKGLPKYRLTFEEGHEFYREISKLTSFKSYSVVFGDENGNWMFAKNSDGDFIGFDVGQINAEPRKTKQSGGDAESKSITFQLLNRKQTDQDYAIVHADSLDFTPQEVPTVNGVTLAFDEIPADLAGTIKLSVLLSSDGTTPVEGLSASNFLINVNGATVAVTAISETSAGHYTLTLASALSLNDAVVADVYDSTLNSDIIVSGGVYYRAKEVSEKVIA